MESQKTWHFRISPSLLFGPGRYSKVRNELLPSSNALGGRLGEPTWGGGGAKLCNHELRVSPTAQSRSLAQGGLPGTFLPSALARSKSRQARHRIKTGEADFGMEGSRGEEVTSRSFQFRACRSGKGRDEAEARRDIAQLVTGAAQT